MKPGRNEPCWCGSGRKYKKCHMVRGDEPPLPFEAITHAADKRSIHQVCLHPNASPGNCSQVIAAHTLQRARVLQAIADKKNHVLTFFPPRLDKNGKLKVQNRGWHQASTFSAFCSKHDTSVFAPLEAAPFIASTEQIFLIAYRAICWELYQKARVLKAKPVFQELVDRGMAIEDQIAVQETLSLSEMGSRKGLANLSVIKALMDPILTSKDYSQFRTYEVTLEGQLSIASTGSITPNLTLDGIELQVLHDVNATTQWLSFGIDLRDSKPSAVFLWFQKDAAPQKYIETIHALSDSKLAEFLAQFFFAHCENTYFSIDWWNSLDAVRQSFVNQLMINWNPYYFPPRYNLGAAITPWKVVNRKLTL